MPTVATDGVNGILAGTSGTFTAVPGAGVTINGQFGSLLINQNGSYVYTRFENARQGGNDVFTYRIFDGDGDETTATLTITVPPDPIPVPVAATAIVDDDGLVAGDQNDGDGDDDVPNTDGDNNQATFTGTLSANFGGQTPGTFNLAAMHNLTATVGQETVRYSWDAGSGILTATIEGGARDDLVLFTVDINTTADPSSDSFTVTLVRNVLHEDQAANTENNATVVLNFTAVDSNGDAVNNTLTITFDDDMPTAALRMRRSFRSCGSTRARLPRTATIATVRTSRSRSAEGLSAPTSSDARTGVGLPAGAEHAGGSLRPVRARSDRYQPGRRSGQGRGDHAAQYRCQNDRRPRRRDGLFHHLGRQSRATSRSRATRRSTCGMSDQTQPRRSGRSCRRRANTLGLQQTITDSDGDSDTSEARPVDRRVPVRGRWSRCDGQRRFTKPVLIVDESPLAEDGDNSDTEAFAGAFGAVIDYGTDGPGSVSYQLLLSSEGAASGLFALDPSDTNPAGGLGKGAAITLHTNGANIEGRVGATVYFTISTDASGNVTLTRNPAVNMWHDDQSNHDDPEILTAAANTVRLQQTVTDADGDTDTAQVDLSTGVFRFEDDGPDATRQRWLHQAGADRRREPAR